MNLDNINMKGFIDGGVMWTILTITNTENMVIILSMEEKFARKDSAVGTLALNELLTALSAKSWEAHFYKLSPFLVSFND